MAYTFKKDTMKATDSFYRQKASYAMRPSYITIHNTANDATAENEISFMKRNPAYGYNISFHIAVDDKEVIQGIEFNRSAWHCGDGLYGKGNRHSVGIEICYSKSGGERYKKAEQNAIEYTARLLIQLDLTPDKVRYHQEWSGKHCPHRILSEGRGKQFKDAVAREYQKLTQPTSKPSPTAPSVTKPEELWRVYDKAGKQVAAYSDSSNAHKHGASIKGIVRHFRAKKLYATKDYRVSAKPKPKADIRVVTASTLNVRSGAGVNYAITDTVKQGDAFTVIKEHSNGWVQFKSGGWVNGRYLKKT